MKKAFAYKLDDSNLKGIGDFIKRTVAFARKAEIRTGKAQTSVVDESMEYYSTRETRARYSLVM